MNVNEELAQELHKPVIKKFLRSKIYARFKDNVWTANLVEVGLLSSFNRGFKSLLRVIDIFTKYVWVKPLYNKNSKTFLDNFIEIANVNVNQINYGLSEEKNFTIALCKNG